MSLNSLAALGLHDDDRPDFDGADYPLPVFDNPGDRSEDVANDNLPPRARGLGSLARLRNAGSISVVTPRDRILASDGWVQHDVHRFGIDDTERAGLNRQKYEKFWRDPHVPATVKYASTVWQTYALACASQGWGGLVPQDRYGKRKPSMIPDRTGAHTWRNDEKVIVKRQHKPGPQKTTPMPVHQILSIGDTLRGDHNLAIINGPATMNVRVLDIDCRREADAQFVRELAREHLGDTPFVRVGQWPKMMLIYREAAPTVGVDDKARWFLKKNVVTLLGADGRMDWTQVEGEELGKEKPTNSIEFLSQGHTWTLYGLHHKTGQSFDWSLGSLHPAIAGPEHAPVIDRAKLARFWSAVQAWRSFENSTVDTSSDPHGSDASFTKYAPAARNSKIWVPEISKGSWVCDPMGYITDGSENYLFRSAWAVCGANTGMLANEHDSLEVLRAFIEHCERKLAVVKSGRLSNGQSVPFACREKFFTARDKWLASMAEFARTGKYLTGQIPYRLLEDGRSMQAQHVGHAARPKDGSLDWLPEEVSPLDTLTGLSEREQTMGVSLDTKKPLEIAADRNARALIATAEERAIVHTSVAAGIDAAFASFLSEVKDRDTTQLPPLHLLKAPTGSGKTVRGIEALAAYCKANPRRLGEGPFVAALPTHNNIDEALAISERTGMLVPMPEIDADDAVKELKGLGVKAAVWRGREKAGCKRKDEVRILQASGIGASSLCGATVDVEIDGEDENASSNPYRRKVKKETEKVDILCPFRERGECGYYNQEAECADADIVFVAHSYLTTAQVPKVLAKARGVIIDESIVYRVLHQRRMPVATLDTPRPPPWLTKEERENKVDAMDLIRQREDACAIAKKALLKGEDPAAALFKASAGGLVSAAITVCKRSHTAERSVRPDLTMAQLVELADRPRGERLIEEEKFWRIVAERLDDLTWDDVQKPLVEAKEVLDADTPVEDYVERAKGKRDARIQTVYVTVNGTQETWVRFSWRSTPNWADAPMMLLDASANPRIMAKVFDRPIVVHDVPAPLHVRTVAMIGKTWSNNDFVPTEDATPKQVAMCKANRGHARQLINKFCGVHAHGRVLIGATVAVRQALCDPKELWVSPPNCDWGHYGAFRGLDFAKHHVAAMSIGRSQQPIHVIDGYAAALTYDDDVPEEPVDVNGNGIGKDNKPLFRQHLPSEIMMRTGRDLTHNTPQLPAAKAMGGIGPVRATWAREIEDQWRSEELRQFVGRLRPVYRDTDEPPTWLAMGKCIPEGIIVDELVSHVDLLRDAPFWAVVRQSAGVMAPGISTEIPSVKRLLDGRSLGDFTGETLAQSKKFVARLMSVMAEVRYKLPGSTTWSKGRIFAWYQDPEAAFLAVCRQVGIVPDAYEITMPARTFITASKSRKPDWVDEALGERERQIWLDKVREYCVYIAEQMPDESTIDVEMLIERHVAGEDIALLIASEAAAQAEREHLEAASQEQSQLEEWEEPPQAED